MEKMTFELFIAKLFLDIYMIILVKGFKKNPLMHALKIIYF